VANTLSIGFEVRRWSQCSAGKSKKASRASRSLVRQATAFSRLREIYGASTRAAAEAGNRRVRRQIYCQICAFMLTWTERATLFSTFTRVNVPALLAYDRWPRIFGIH
jgi:hypothetical protein